MKGDIHDKHDIHDIHDSQETMQHIRLNQSLFSSALKSLPFYLHI